MLLGLVGVWYDNFFGAETAGGAAVQPVPRALPRVPPAARDGEQRQVGRPRGQAGSQWQTGPIVWGQPGTNGQHAYYQLIHQGTKLIPCDFIGFAQANERSATTRTCSSPTARADRGARVRQDARRGARPRACRRTRCRTARSRATTRPTRSSRRSSRRTCSASSSRSTSTRCSPRARSGTSTRSTSGASSSARSSRRAIVPELDAADEPDARPRLVDERRSSAGTGACDRG